METWERCIKFVLAREGGYINHPNDKGGKTNMGITEGTLNSAYKKGLVTNNNVATLSRSDAEKIYRAMYWAPFSFDLVPFPACLALFDSCVNHGKGNMTKFAQRTCNGMGASLMVDGAWGPKTKAEVLAKAHYSGWVSKFMSIRKEFFDAIVKNNPSQKVFINGWYNRLRHLAKEMGVASPV
jgi:lysozyme family protein